MEDFENKMQSLIDVKCTEKNKVSYNKEEDCFIYENKNYKVVDVKELEKLFLEKTLNVMLDLYECDALENNFKEDCLTEIEEYSYTKATLSEIYEEENEEEFEGNGFDYGFDLMNFFIESWGLDEVFDYFLGDEITGYNENGEKEIVDHSAFRESVFEDTIKAEMENLTYEEMANFISSDGECEADERIGYYYYIFKV